MLFDGFSLPYRVGDIAVIPPLIPHTNASREGFSNIYICLANPTLVTRQPFLVQDDSNRFLLSAFSAIFFHYSTLDHRNTAVLSAYGSLLATYLQYYEQAAPRSSTVETIKNAIINNFPDVNFELDSYLHSFPFNYD